MPHVPKSTTHTPVRLTPFGSATRPELSGVRVPQAKTQILVRKAAKKSKAPGESFMPKLDPMKYGGPETEPGQVFRDLFGKDIQENDFGVMVR
jgi:hypothetical protein